MKQPVTAIFDIGKTNKKFFLFDEDFREVHHEKIQLSPLIDDDGYPCDDLPGILKWMQERLDWVFQVGKYEIRHMNFSTYGASFVHVDADGNILTPLYNYTKPYPEDLLQKFYNTYGDEATLSLETASPSSGMLNSGLQLYWLKHTRPAIFEKIKYSLHFPQFLSYYFTGIPVSDYTSIGCHTSLWDYAKRDYHAWVYREDLVSRFGRLVPTSTYTTMHYKGADRSIGVGIHDSSSALLPYLKGGDVPFILVSTGTWSISLNPFNRALLSSAELNSGCLCYMQTDGSPVKASRLFLGNEHALQVKKLEALFQKSKGLHRSISFDEKIYKKLTNPLIRRFALESIEVAGGPQQTDISDLTSFEEAYHQLMFELIELQIEAIGLAKGASPIQTLFVDGGFADNTIFLSLLARHFPDCLIYSTQTPLGSALGAAIAIADKGIHPGFLQRRVRVHTSPASSNT